MVSVDAMGGDRGPAAVVAGIAGSAEMNPDIRFILHGPAEELDAPCREAAARRPVSRSATPRAW